MQICGMPTSLCNLKSDCHEEAWNSFLNHPTGRLLNLNLSYTAGLAFKKAWRLKTLPEAKHYNAQYQLFLIDLACKAWQESDDDLMYAIKNAFDSFHCQMFDTTLTEEEYPFFLNTAKAFFSKYYKLHPEELNGELE